MGGGGADLKARFMVSDNEICNTVLQYQHTIIASLRISTLQNINSDHCYKKASMFPLKGRCWTHLTTYSAYVTVMME